MANEKAERPRGQTLLLITSILVAATLKRPYLMHARALAVPCRIASGKTTTPRRIKNHLLLYELTVWIRKLLAHFCREKVLEQLGQPVGLLHQKPVVTRAIPLADTYQYKYECHDIHKATKRRGLGWLGAEIKRSTTNCPFSRQDTSPEKTGEAEHAYTASCSHGNAQKTKHRTAFV